MPRTRAVGFERWLRRAPLGIVALSTLLCLLGSSLVLGGIYLGLTRPHLGWAGWLSALLLGPLTVYVGVCLLSLAPWTWSTMVLLFCLLLVSSAIRLAFTLDLPVVPIAEMALALVTLAYLIRVRGNFKRER